MYILTDISRAHSSGEETSSKQVFQTLEKAVSYITNDWYEALCVDYDYPAVWDVDDMGCSFPTKEEFTQTVMEKVRTMKTSVEIYNPYSDYCRHVPIELQLYLSKN